MAPPLASDSSDSPTPPDVFIDKNAGLDYWQSVGADVDSMLGGVPSAGGFSSVSRIDLIGSRSFLARLGIGIKGDRCKVASALEGGAGIGRITQGLLVDIAEQVDVVEPIAKFTQKLVGRPGVRHIHNIGLQDWEPAEGLRYDLIWVQWCLGHLTDLQLVAFLRRCQGALSPEGGVLVVKENLSSSGLDVYDETDSSVTR
ncbi:Alpha N-terminal protein methyltransferase 1 [Escovopsis weberi]|uniref:Alpha N-terminal protein methyltransferase 1 n=1 Tax=Escovopsis weberi TaxID=150374 RepID=A0A0M9VWJ8_ESCWE|nr:Alpha N-terminal protein methyltransferase 1 [Escovopsis weberi]